MSCPIAEPVYVAGHQGMVGSAVVRHLRELGICQLVTATRQEIDLRQQQAAQDFFEERRPATVVFAAARVGGIQANHSRPAEFMYDNLAMATNTIHAAWISGVQRFLFLGSTCIYPRMAPQPIDEDSLLTGPLEPTNEAYALAKIAGLKLCQFYRRQYDCLFHSAMPTNLYGPGDNYHPQYSHVLPALIRRFHDAHLNGVEEVAIWGSGRPRREFLHVDDLARAVIHLLQLADPPDWLNVGTGEDISIAELARLVADTVGYTGRIIQDPSRPDGTPLKCSDVRRIEATGWAPRIPLAEGLRQTYQCFQDEQQSGSLREV